MTSSFGGFQALVENGADAIMLVDAEGQILYASASATKVLGYEPEELVGRKGPDLFHPLDRDHGARMLKSTLAEPRKPRRIQMRIRRKDGQWRWVESTASNLLDEPRVGAIVFSYRDLENGGPQDDGMRRCGQEFKDAHAGIETFAHTLAHDLKEPLLAISILAELLVRKARLNEADRDAAWFLIDRVRGLTASLDELLSTATRDFQDSLRPMTDERNQA